MLSCEVCKTFKNTYFEEYLQTTASGGVLQKKPVLKNYSILLYNIHRKEEASDKFCEKAVLAGW